MAIDGKGSALWISTVFVSEDRPLQTHEKLQISGGEVSDLRLKMLKIQQRQGFGDIFFVQGEIDDDIAVSLVVQGVTRNFHT